jgi:hypothetical protein
VIQLIVGLTAFLAGVFVRRIRSIWAYFRARKFWRPLLHRDLTLILGDGFSELRVFEVTDFIGRGDLVASDELISYISGLGFRRLQPAFADKIMGADFIGRALQRNLIILGGPDANGVGKEFLAKIAPRYVLEWVAHEDELDSKASSAMQVGSTPQFCPTNGSQRLEFNDLPAYRPTWDGEHLTRDYGVIIRATNPFLPRKKLQKTGKEAKIVMMYGCYGFGTLAAVLFSQTPQFLQMISKASNDLECVVSCDIIMDTPQSLNCVYFKDGPGGFLSEIATDK